jgi:crotonobetainyl-CoA:carnitine CoA-transferase CaiB-like acyl-CoA transferase
MSVIETLTEKARVHHGVAGDDALLTLTVETTLDKVLADIHQHNLPRAMYNTIAEMIADAFRMAKATNGEDAGKIVGSISSVTDNGQSVSYRENPYAAAVAKACETVLKDYDRMLSRYRKAGW